MTLARLIATIAFLLGTTSPAAGAGPERLPAAGAKPRLRQPTAMALVDDGKKLLVANARSGTMSVIDLVSRECTGEFAIGGRLADIAVLPNQSYVLVIDEERHELIGLERLAEGFAVRARLPIADSPVSLVVTPDGKRCCVASLWSRKLTIMDISALANGTGTGSTPMPPSSGKAAASEPLAVPSGENSNKTPMRITHEIPLPFAPRELQLLPRGKQLLVADSFGGRLALVDLERGVVESTREVPGHNIRGLALSRDGRSLFVSHQMLSPLARTEEADIHWGLLVAGRVLVLSVDSLIDPQADILKGSWSLRPGDAGRGAGDPAGIVPLPGDQRLLLAGSGTGEILEIDLSGVIRRVPLGGHPTDLLLSADATAVYVANAFADSVAVLDTAGLTLTVEIPLGPVPELAAAERGERLFYDARLSHGGWFSCHSCHTDGHSNGLLADTLSDGSYGDPKRVLSLRGVGETGPWAWNGEVTRLEDQIKNSIRTTMHGPPLPQEQMLDLTAFLKALPPPPPAARDEANAEHVARGRALFDRLRCNRCHVPPTYTSPDVYDVGLADEAGRRQFNPPSLRGVGQHSRFFHDGRATSLEDVFGIDRHQLDRELTEQERSDLVEFLRCL